MRTAPALWFAAASLLACAFTALLGCAATPAGLSPDFINIKSTRVEGGSVMIEGDTSVPYLYYKGFTSRVVDGVMTVSLDYTVVKTKSGLGAFSVSIPTEGRPIAKVLISGGGKERRIF